MPQSTRRHKWAEETPTSTIVCNGLRPKPPPRSNADALIPAAPTHVAHMCGHMLSRVGYMCGLHVWAHAVSCGLHVWATCVGYMCGLHVWATSVGTCSLVWATCVGYMCGHMQSRVGYMCGLHVWAHVVSVPIPGRSP